MMLVSQRLITQGRANQRILLPDPATELRDGQELTLGEGGE